MKSIHYLTIALLLAAVLLPGMALANDDGALEQPTTAIEVGESVMSQGAEDPGAEMEIEILPGFMVENMGNPNDPWNFCPDYCADTCSSTETENMCLLICLDQRLFCDTSLDCCGI